MKLFGAGALFIAALAAPLSLSAQECEPTATRLCITAGDRVFEVEVDYSTVQAGGRSGKAGAVNLAPQMPGAGLFTFFADSNPEVLVKILDGCAVNAHYWVLYSAATNVGFTIEVRDNALGGTTWRHGNADLTPSVSVQDVRAIPCFGVRPV